MPRKPYETVTGGKENHRTSQLLTSPKKTTGALFKYVGRKQDAFHKTLEEPTELGGTREKWEDRKI